MLLTNHRDDCQPMTEVPAVDLANSVRFLAIDAVESANSGHPGMPMGMADVATVLFTRYLKFDARDPNWRATARCCCTRFST